MFTGIIQEVGKVVRLARSGGGVHLQIDAPLCAAGMRVSDSVSVNGVCQTVIGVTKGSFTVEAVEETLRKTTAGELVSGSPVNIELPVRPGDRLGGHLVQGHVDDVGVVTSVVKQASSWLVTVEFPREFSRYVVPVGSIAIDGVSLTVASVKENRLIVSIIPHTLEKTTLSRAQVGRRVNLEFDLVGKYVEKLLSAQGEGGLPGGLTEDLLRSWGYGS